MGRTLRQIANNSGQLIAIPGTENPIPGTGATLTATLANTNYTQTVTAGRLYAVTIDDATDTVFFGVANTTTAANRIWVTDANGSLQIYIPDNITSLHFSSDTAGTNIYLRELDRLYA